MDIKDLNVNTFADMFGGGTQKATGLNFGMVESEQDIASIGLETAGLVEGVEALPKEEIDNQEVKEVETSATTEPKEVDILSGKEEKKTEEAKQEELKGLSEYFHQRMKEGKFVAINDVDEKGNKVPFIPKTAEDFDEVIEMQVNWKLEQAKNDLDAKWYESKSPAWKAVSQYAEMVDDPTKLIPFLQGVQTIQSVSSFDENEIDGAEEIVRIRLEQSGDPEEVIAAQIEALKTTDKLISTAKSVKPIILQQEQQSLARQVQEEQMRERERIQLLQSISQNAYKAIEQPIFGKQKLKNDEKAAIYNLIGEPSEETQGYAIYSEIDKLFEKGDFETLKQVALLLTKKDSFFGYLGTDVANKTAAGLQRKLQLATESRTASGNDYDEEKIPVVNRNSYNRQVRFGGNEK